MITVVGLEERITKRYAQIRAEYEALQASIREAIKAGSPHDKPAVAMNGPARHTYYCRRMIELAESSPADPGARDALLWVLDAPWRGDMGAYHDEFSRAAALLVRYHGNDPEAVRIGLRLDNVLNPGRDAVLFGFYSAAKDREAKGLARLALAQYLKAKSEAVVRARSVEGRPKHRRLREGKVVHEFDLTNDEYAYHLELRQCDPNVIRAEAERLFEEVISEFGDLPHVTRRQRELEALIKEPTPKQNGLPLTDERRRNIERIVAQEDAWARSRGQTRRDVEPRCRQSGAGDRRRGR